MVSAHQLMATAQLQYQALTATHCCVKLQTTPEELPPHTGKGDAADAAAAAVFLTWHCLCCCWL
jgi:hypothetical protein